MRPLRFIYRNSVISELYQKAYFQMKQKGPSKKIKSFFFNHILDAHSTQPTKKGEALHPLTQCTLNLLFLIRLQVPRYSNKLWLLIFESKFRFQIKKATYCVAFFIHYFTFLASRRTTYRRRMIYTGHIASH